MKISKNDLLNALFISNLLSIKNDVQKKKQIIVNSIAKSYNKISVSVILFKTKLPLHLLIVFCKYKIYLNYKYEKYTFLLSI